MVQSVLRAPGQLQGDHNGTGVVRAQHALSPPQQRVADQLPGTRDATRCLKEVMVNYSSRSFKQGAKIGPPPIISGPSDEFENLI